MDIITAIKTRKSCRGFLPKPVPKEIIREILETSLRAPSAVNSQPWEITAVSGEALENIKRDNIKNLLSGVPYESYSDYQGIYGQRRIDLAKEIFKLMEIKREDREKRGEWTQRGYRFFDAPAALILSVDKAVTGYRMAIHDVGILAQTICLAAMDYRLGTCIERQGVVFGDVIRKHTGLPESKVFIIGIAVGYPDTEFPANRLISARAALDEVATFVGS